MDVLSWDPVFPGAAQLAPKETYSFSRLRLFEQCPKAYWLQYIACESERVRGIEAFTGTCAHGALEVLNNELQLNRMVSLSGLKNLFDDIWKRDEGELPLRIVQNHPVEYYQAIGHQCLENYYLTNYPFTDFEILYAERHLSFELGGYTLRGFVDLIGRRQDTWIIADYKTSSKIASQLEMAQSLQFSIYDMGLRDQLMLGEETPIEIVGEYLREDKKLLSFRSPVQRERAKTEILRIIDSIEEATELQHFPYRVNFRCDWCGYSDDCPAYQEHQMMKAA